MTLTVLWSRSDALRIRELVTMNQVHEHHLHAVRGEEAAGTDMGPIPKWHHVVCN